MSLLTPGTFSLGAVDYQQSFIENYVSSYNFNQDSASLCLEVNGKSMEIFPKIRGHHIYKGVFEQ